MKVVSIVGRPNVGKSTLFNRLIGERKAVVDDRPGVTRDRIYGVVSYHGKRFILVDTGGLVFEEKGILEEVRRQVDFAVEEADLILFMVDVKEGVHPLDRDIADYLRKKEKEVWVLVNKVDNEKRLTEAEEFHSLG
ncbi:ribosome biogenesis GTPase Der, partial [bacterium]